MQKQPNDKNNQTTSREHLSVLNNTQHKELGPIVSIMISTLKWHYVFILL